ncbi:MAG: transposase [Succinivibrio sp.]|nr:transposase [Succinivibrio sp.]
MSSTPDFKSLTREELEALLAKQQELLTQKDELLKQKEAEAAAEKLQFHKKLSTVKEKLAAANSDNQKLKVSSSNLATIYENLLVYIKENRLNSMTLFRDECLPSIYEYHKLDEFLINMAFSLIDSVRQLHYHQEHSLNLGSSEKNKGELPPTDNDRNLETLGQEENAREAEIRESDEQQFEYDSESAEDTQVKIYAPANYPDAVSANRELYRYLHDPDEHEVQDKLKNAIAALKDLHDPSYNNEGVVKRRPERHYVSANSSNEVAGILSYGNRKSVYMYCHKCGKVTEFILNSRADRVNTLYTLTNGNRDVKNTLAPVYTACCPECGTTTQLNPAAVPDLHFIEDLESLKGEGKLCLNTESAKQQAKTGAQTEQVSNLQTNGSEPDRTASQSHRGTVFSAEQNSCETAHSCLRDEQKTIRYREDDAERQKDRRRLYRTIKSNQNNLTMPCGNYNFIDGTDVIDPWSFNAKAYAMTPAFVKSRLSVGLLSVMGATFCQMGVAKNKIKTVFDGAGLPISRDQLTGGINCFARAFLHRVADKIKTDILNTSETCLMDESHLLVIETANKKKPQGKSRKSEIWVLNSDWTADINASYFHISPTRAGSTAVEILKNISKTGRKYLLVDGYSGYDAAVRKLNKEYGTNIVLARCHTHCRRPLHKFLKDSGLIKVYNQYLLPKNSAFTDFCNNLNKYRASRKARQLTERESDLLTIYYLINSLFVVDSAVAVKHNYQTTSEEFKQELMLQRQQRSVRILDALFDAIKIFIAKNPIVMKASINAKGQICYTPNKIFAESSALLYLIRYEQDLRRFIESPSIELTQSSCERAIKDIISVRRNSQKLQSEDGAAALADFMTISHTCALNHVSVQQYLLWLVANIKHRLYQMKLNGHEDPTFFSMPKKAALLVDDRKIRLGIYDPRNKMCYDKIDVTGLTPYEYKRFLESGIKQSA